MCANYSGSPVRDPLQNDLDAGGNSLNNVAAVEADKVANVADYVVGTGSGLEDVVNNRLASQETIFIGGGDITISNKLDFSGLSDVAMAGRGRENTVIKYDGSDNFAIDLTNTQRLKMGEFVLRGVSTPSADGIGNDNGVDGPRRSFFANIKVDGFGGDGFNFSEIWQTLFLHLRARQNDRGIRINSGGQDNTFISCSFTNSTQEAIRVENGGNVFLGGEASTSDKGVVLVAGGARETHFLGLHHENNAQYDYHSESNAIGTKIAPTRMDANIGMHFPDVRDMHINLGGCRWASGDNSTCVQLGDTNAGTTAYRTTIIGNPRDDSGTSSTLIDNQDVTDGTHYSYSGATTL